MRELAKIAVMGLVCVFSISLYAQVNNSNGQASNNPSTMGSTPMMQKPMIQKKRGLSFSDMSPEQQQKIKTIVENMRLDMKQTMDKLRQGRQGMSQFITGEKFDGSGAQEYAEQQGRLYAKMMYMRMKTRYEIYQVMTPKQKAEIQRRMQAEEMKRQTQINYNQHTQ